MANTLLTPSVIANAALATLYENTVMAQIVHRDYSSEFVAKVGDTVTIRKPATFEAKEFNPTTGIDVQDGTEDSTTVRIDKHADVSFAVTTKELSLELGDFREQLLDPAMEAISQKIDRDLLTLRDQITKEVGSGTTLWSNPSSLVDAGTELDVALAPSANRHVVVGPRTRGEWLKNDLLKTANQSGSTAGLRQGSIGSDLFGFSAYMSQNVGQPKASPAVGEPTTEVNIAFHRNALALVTRQLELPMGAANAYIASYKGFGIRVVIGYDQAKKKDVVSLDCLYGVKALDPSLAVLIKGPDKA